MTKLNSTVQNYHPQHDGEIMLHAYDVVNMIFFVAIMIIGMFGNSLIVYFIGWKKRGRIKRFEGFLLILGVIDLIASIFIPLSFLYLTATNFERWHFGEEGCKVIPSLLQVSITLSQGMLIIISYERYHTLVKPFNERIKKSTIAVWLFLVFVLAVVLVIPYMSTFILYNDPINGIQMCAPNDPSNRLFMTSSSLQMSRDIIAIGIMGFLNSRMSHALTKQHDKLTWERRKMSEKGRRLLRRVIMIFSGLTLPVDVYHVVIYALFMAKVPLNENAHIVIRILNTFLNVVQTSNSVVNVFIYSRMHYMFHLECCVPTSRKGQTTCSKQETVSFTGRKSSTSVQLTRRTSSTAKESANLTGRKSFAVREVLQFTRKKCSTVKESVHLTTNKCSTARMK